VMLTACAILVASAREVGWPFSHFLFLGAAAFMAALVGLFVRSMARVGRALDELNKMNGLTLESINRHSRNFRIGQRMTTVGMGLGLAFLAGAFFGVLHNI
jgi:hypothetical protein